MPTIQQTILIHVEDGQQVEQEQVNQLQYEAARLAKQLCENAGVNAKLEIASHPQHSAGIMQIDFIREEMSAIFLAGKFYCDTSVDVLNANYVRGTLEFAQQIGAPIERRIYQSIVNLDPELVPYMAADSFWSRVQTTLQQNGVLVDAKPTIFSGEVAFCQTAPAPQIEEKPVCKPC
jgi:hypothetical protein